MESLGIELSKIPLDLLLNILNIVLLFVIVRTLAYKPVRKFMDARTARVNAAREEAAAQCAEAQSAKEKYEALAAQSEVQAAQALSDAEKKASARAQEILDEAHRQAQAILAEAETTAQKAHDDALKNMQNEVVTLAFDISEKLLARSVCDEDTKKMADRLFDSCANGGDSE